MIDVKELRIGNLFENESDKQLLKVCGISESNITFDAGKKIEGKWQAKPIPLNEQWMKKLGFTDDGFHIDEGCNIGKYNGEDYIYFMWDEFDFKHIKYVHQVQNIFYFMTGKELELNHNV